MSSSQLAEDVGADDSLPVRKLLFCSAWAVYSRLSVTGWILFTSPFAERAPKGADMMAMLRAGELDAVIVGNDVPDDPGLRTVFPDPDAAAAAFFARHRIVPVNHMLCVTRRLAEESPERVREVLRMVRASAAPVPPGPHGAPPDSREALRPVIELALRYMTEQDMLPDGIPASLRRGRRRT